MKKIYISYDAIYNGIYWVDTEPHTSKDEDDDNYYAGPSKESPLIELTLPEDDDGDIEWVVHTGQGV